MPKKIPYETGNSAIDEVPVRGKGKRIGSMRPMKGEMGKVFNKRAATPPEKLLEGGGDNETGEKENVVDEKVEVELTDNDLASAVKQIAAEFKYASEFIDPKWKKWGTRLKLYNNQKRNADAIGDPLLFTIFQTILASLYSDKLTVEFVGREHGDDETAENQTILAQYDTEEMMKDVVDYTWIWDTLFCGRGYVLMDEWDDERHNPVIQNIDPFTFYRDPDAKSVNGDHMGRGAAGFMGREIRMSKHELESVGCYDMDKILRVETASEDSPNPQTNENSRARREAQGFDNARAKLCGDNATYVLYEWWTWFNGERYQFTLNSDRSKICRVKKILTKKWPIVDRVLFPSAHEWEGVSVPDLVEDKQRARAIIMNLAKKGVTAALYPNYVYNNLIIKNKADLLNWEFNKFIGVPGNPQGAVAAIERKPVTSDVQWMLDVMDFSAQKATATPDIQQGAITEKVKSATEIAKVTQGVDTRYSLSSKIFGWSEKAFWKLWYEMYNIYFEKGIDGKIARITGPFGPSYRRISRDNLIGNADPDIMIESKAISDAKRMNRLNMLMAVMNQAVAMDPNTNKRFGLKEICKSAGMSTDEINRLLPKTFDEYEAEEENKLLDRNQMPQILIGQNHMVHIEVHSKAADSKAKKVHIEMHKIALYGLTHNPNLTPKQEAEAMKAGGSDVAAARKPGQPEPSPMEQGTAPAPRDMMQSPLQLQSPTAIQMAQ